MSSTLKLKGFNIRKFTNPANVSLPVGRRHYHKIIFVKGHVTIHLGGETIKIKEACLFFANPQIPHSAVHHSKKNRGYSCVFTEAFIGSRVRMELLQNSPLYRTDLPPVVQLNSEQEALMVSLYEKMLGAHQNDYHYSDELIKSCIELIIHEAVSRQPAQSNAAHKDAATRITQLFLETLEKQFPVERATDSLSLRTAQDFAKQLSVHVNYLNRSIKKVTGKPTTTHIAERIITEAKALLQHTDWSVADIAYSLGFEYPTYFNNYFKRTTGHAPKYYRKTEV